MDSKSNTTPKIRQFFTTGKIFLIFILLMIIPRLYAYHQPIEKDLALYSVISHELLEGRSLYSDLWEHKPPALFFTIILAQLIGGYGPGSIFLLGITSSIITLFGVYFAASLLGKSRETGLWAASFWAVTSADVLLQADQVNVEAFMIPCFVLAFALILRAQGTNLDKGRWLLIGVLIAWASLYKHIAIFFAIAMAIVHFASPPQGSSRKNAFSQILLIAFVGFLSWTLTFLYFFMVGRFQIFWDTLFVFNQYYAGNIFHNLWIGLSPNLIISENSFGVLPLLGLSLLGMAFSKWRSWSRAKILFSAYIIATYIMVTSPGMFYTHYYQLWVPILCIGSAWTISEIKKKTLTGKGYRWIGPAVLSILIILQASYYRFTPAEWSILKYKDRYINMESGVKNIQRILLSNELFHVWGYDPGLYFYTKISPVSGVLIHTAFFNGPLVEKLSNQIQQNMSKNMPDLFVVTPIGGEELPLFKWILENYRPFPNQNRFWPYKFYYLHGSALEKRVIG